MSACFSKALRTYPPTLTGFPRVAPLNGGIVSGIYIPEGTTVYVSQHSVSYSERNFKKCDKYVPERWLGDIEYKDDKRDVVQPFSFGPRSCLGRKYVAIYTIRGSFPIHVRTLTKKMLLSRKCRNAPCLR